MRVAVVDIGTNSTRLLVADDSFTTRELIRTILQSAGYSVTTAVDVFRIALHRYILEAQRKHNDGEPLAPFAFWGPTCDSIDHMKGPFLLPSRIREGDYIEIGNTGAYGRSIAGGFNGYGVFEEAILTDEPMLSMYARPQPAVATADVEQAQA